MELFDAIFQGVLQGLTEFLPVSSSGHLAIYQHITGITENNLFFSVMLHIGTLAAVTAVYFKIIFRLFAALGSLLKKIFTGKFKWKEMTDQENLAMMIIIGLLPLFLLFIPVPGTDMKIKDLAEKFSANDGYFFVIGILLYFTGRHKPAAVFRQQKQAACQNHQRQTLPQKTADTLYMGRCIDCRFYTVSCRKSRLIPFRFYSCCQSAQRH